MSRIPPVTPAHTAPVPVHPRPKPPAPPAAAEVKPPPFQGVPPKVGFRV